MNDGGEAPLTCVAITSVEEFTCCRCSKSDESVASDCSDSVGRTCTEQSAVNDDVWAAEAKFNNDAHPHSQTPSSKIRKIRHDGGRVKCSPSF